jgi:hypothetical protein
MNPNDVRARIEELAYTTIFTPELADNAQIDRVAEGIWTQRGFRHSAAEYSEAIALVLARGHLSERALLIGGHEESEMRNWLARLGERLNPSSGHKGHIRGGS